MVMKAQEVGPQTTPKLNSETLCAFLRVLQKQSLEKSLHLSFQNLFQ